MMTNKVCGCKRDCYRDLDLSSVTFLWNLFDFIDKGGSGKHAILLYDIRLCYDHEKMRFYPE